MKNSCGKGAAPVRVDVLCGGDSPEREVSLSSGRAVTGALEERGFRVREVDVLSKEDVLKEVIASDADVFFVALHGGWGEDGTLQNLLEFLGRPYTGSGPKACMKAMDKILSKALFRQAGVPTPPSRCFEHFPKDLPVSEVEELFEKWSKVVVKPACCGSTVGVSIAGCPAGFSAAMECAFSYGDAILVEKYIPGKEITVTVWQEEGRILALPAVEIKPKKGFYTYDAKYVPGNTEYFCPAPLGEEIASTVTEAALNAHLALGCRVYSRVDLRLSPEGEPFVLEVNTAPGMTATSLVPKAAAAFGWSFAELCGRIVSNSLPFRRC